MAALASRGVCAAQGLTLSATELTRLEQALRSLRTAYDAEQHMTTTNVASYRCAAPGPRTLQLLNSISIRSPPVPRQPGVQYRDLLTHPHTT